MKYLSICSGIEAASVAWHPLGWQPVGFSEIEPFPSAVLAHHWPDVPNLGDMTKHNEWPNTIRPDLIVGGTPCQAFSVAGLRKGLADPRGNLTLTFLSILEQYRPTWVVWENVPGVLSEKSGAFGAFLGGLGELGYGFAYRILDAQFFGVAQRRRRVFVVGHLGDWRRAAAVLFERDSLSGDLAPSRKKRKGTSSFTQAGFGGYREGVGTLRANGGDYGGGTETLIPARMVAFGEYVEDDTASTCKTRDYKDATDLVASFGEIVRPLTARHDSSPCADKGMDIIAVNTTQEKVYSIAENIIGRQDHNGGNGKGFQEDIAYIKQATAVRRLTPTECERLQGFPDGHTLIEWRGKPADQCPDGPRYKALGNSMAVPVMAWIGKRIQEISSRL